MVQLPAAGPSPPALLSPWPPRRGPLRRQQDTGGPADGSELSAPRADRSATPPAFRWRSPLAGLVGTNRRGASSRISGRQVRFASHDNVRTVNLGDESGWTSWPNPRLHATRTRIPFTQTTSRDRPDER